MRTESIKSLESLNWYCHLGGLFSVFIGLVVSFMDLLKGDFSHIHVGIYIFFTGYALVKISAKLSKILADETFAGNPDSPMKGKT